MNKSNYFGINLTKDFVEITIANKIYIVLYNYLFSIIKFDTTLHQTFPHIHRKTQNNINLNYCE